MPGGDCSTRCENAARDLSHRLPGPWSRASPSRRQRAWPNGQVTPGRWSLSAGTIGQFTTERSGRNVNSATCPNTEEPPCDHRRSYGRARWSANSGPTSASASRSAGTARRSGCRAVQRRDSRHDYFDAAAARAAGAGSRGVEVTSSAPEARSAVDFLVISDFSIPFSLIPFPCFFNSP